MTRLALRNLARNRWRSGLTVTGVAVAAAALVWSETVMESFLEQLVGSVAAVQLGDLRVESEAHARESLVYDAFPVTRGLLDRVRGVPGVRRVAPRLVSFGLLGRAARSQGALILGADPDAEAAASDVARSIVAGAWLSSEPREGDGGRAVVLGADLAAQLSATVGDELVVLLQAADGSMADDRLRVVGLARTGTSELDRRAAWMRLADVGWLAALEGQAHELMIRLEGGAALPAVAGAVRAAVAGAEGAPLVVRTWEELAPDVRRLVDLTRITMSVLFGIVYFVAALGILNTQRMTALERRRELAVMMAIGVTPARLARLVVLETALLTGLGVTAGALLGWAMSAWHAHAGLDLTGLASRGFSYGGAAIGSRLYPEVRLRFVAGPALSVLALGSLCSAWPAVASARLVIVRAISGRA